MDIADMSVYLNQTSVQSAASILVLKMAMNSSTENATQMTEMMSNTAADPTRGTIIDATV